MGYTESEDKPEQRLCPTHGCRLEEVHSNVLQVWYCPQCDCCYAEQMETEFQGRMTISGKRVVCLPGELPRRNLRADAKPQASPKARKPDNAAADLAEQIQVLPLSEQIQFCPIHDRQLEMRIAAVSDSSGWAKEVDVGYCPECQLFYTNHQAAAMHPNARVRGVPVVWNPKLFREYWGKKARPFFETSSIRLRNARVHIEKKCPTPDQDVVARALNEFTAPDGFPIKISGVYALGHRGFVCSLTNYLAAVPPEDDPYVQREDPKSLVKKARKDPNSPYNKKALAAARNRRRRFDEWKQEQIARKEQREWVERSALPYQCYTLPLLKDADCCPFCSGALSKQILRVVVYHERRADKVIFVSGWYCAHCEVPLIDQEGETALLRRVAPGMVYIFDAKSCCTPQELLNRAKEKILVRELPREPERPAPKETEKLNDVQVPDVLSNLSYEPDTKVWVYAERCHCAACQKKYGRDMIQNRTALIETVTHKTIQVTVQFCTGCGKYYMNLSAFRQYCRKYGGILLECVMTPELCRKNSSWLNFRPDTILSRCGYSVREGVPKEHRQAVLAYVLDSGRASKHEIIELITGFTKIRHTRMPAACKRWEEDLLFVSQYQIQRQPQVKGLTFRWAGRTGRREEPGERKEGKRKGALP